VSGTVYGSGEMKLRAQQVAAIRYVKVYTGTIVQSSDETRFWKRRHADPYSRIVFQIVWRDLRRKASPVGASARVFWFSRCSAKKLEFGTFSE
jgi:hypothetical protein